MKQHLQPQYLWHDGFSLNVAPTIYLQLVTVYGLCIVSMSNWEYILYNVLAMSMMQWGEGVKTHFGGFPGPKRHISYSPTAKNQIKF